LKLSKTFFLLSLAVGSLAGGSARAHVVEHVQETLASGATFEGNLTFADDFSRLLGADGTLRGGAYADDHLTWNWRAAIGVKGANSTDVDGVRNDWLMDGPYGIGQDNYFGIAWAFPLDTLVIDLAPEIDTYYVGYDGLDRVVSASASVVPEPASVALLGLGLAGAGAARRRKG
jgi:hypothetical protein